VLRFEDLSKVPELVEDPCEVEGSKPVSVGALLSLRIPSGLSANIEWGFRILIN
jgi:hypothetical protein